MADAQLMFVESTNEGALQQVRARAQPKTASLVPSFITFKLQNHSRSVLSCLLQQLSKTVFLNKILQRVLPRLENPS